MKKLFRQYLTTVFAVALLFVCASISQSYQYYIEGNLGYENLNGVKDGAALAGRNDVSFMSPNIPIKNSSLKYAGTIGTIAWVFDELKVGFDYRFSLLNFSGEVFIDDYQESGTPYTEDDIYKSEGQIINNTISIGGYYPILNDMDIFATAGFGYYFGKSKLDWNIIFSDGDKMSGAEKKFIDESGLSIRVGIGIIYYLTQTIGVKCELDYNNYTGSKVFSADIDFMAGIRFYF